MFRKIKSMQLYLLSALLLVSCRVTQSGVTVNTRSGTVEGETITFNGKEINRFLGIPFAKPPVGELRFKKPVPVEPWNKTIKAKEFKPGCIQYSPLPFPWKDDMPGLTEDCLYLNIWAPKFYLPSEIVKTKMSVMFLIHTGGFTESSSRVDFFNGVALAARGGVIVVTTNFRLGAQGFIYSGTEDAPGNMGMLDLVMALKWVNDNIEKFGGNKSSITVFGHSAGAISAGLFCVSPLTQGLFQKVILESGSPIILSGENNNLDFQVTQKIAELVGCADTPNSLQADPQKVVSCLRNANAFKLDEALLNATQNITNAHPVYPRYNDSFLPQNPLESFKKGEFQNVKVLIGVNNGDGALLLNGLNISLFGFFGQNNPKIDLTLGRTLIRNYFKNYPDVDADSIADQYLRGLPEDDYDKIREQVFRSIGGFERTCPANYFGEFMSSKNPHVYYYLYTHESPNAPWAPWMLASHFEEVPFVFGYPFRYPQNYTKKEQELSQRLIDYWSRFAKFGTPTPSPLPPDFPLSDVFPKYNQWPKYSRKDPKYKVLNIDVFETQMGLQRNNCDFFRPYFGL